MRLTLNQSSRNVPFEASSASFVTIVEGTPYTVPAGKIFVLTGLGTADLADNTIPNLAELRADGVLEIMGGLYGCSMLSLQGVGWVVPDACTAAQVPDCISFAEGVELAVSGGGGGGDCRAFGYLGDA